VCCRKWALSVAALKVERSKAKRSMLVRNTVGSCVKSETKLTYALCIVTCRSASQRVVCVLWSTISGAERVLRLCTRVCSSMCVRGDVMGSIPCCCGCGRLRMMIACVQWPRDCTAASRAMLICFLDACTVHRAGRRLNWNRCSQPNRVSMEAGEGGREYTQLNACLFSS